MIRFLLIAIFLGAATLGRCAEAPTKSQADARALLDDITSLQPAQNSEVLATLKVRGADGARRDVPVRYTITVSPDQWQGKYETQPTDGGLTETLVITHRLNHPNDYKFARSGSQPTVLTNSNTFVSFAATDFWIGDLGLEFLYWPGQDLVKREMRRGRSCRVIESINPLPGNAGYHKVRSWLDLETGALIRAEGYDAQGKLLKEFSIRSFKRINGRWELKEIEIRNEQTDSRTRLEFDLKAE